MNDSCTIDGFGPVSVQRVGSTSELSELIRRAGSENQAVYPLGGRTMLDLGLPPARPGVAVDLRALDQIIDYPARDMTITVQAGITLAHLADTLRPENQRLPVDIPRPTESTLGGALAANSSGPRRYGFGTLRDYVIGITVVNDEATEAKAGGRVVKNVAGYDLCKLHVGALGTLGIITQVTLRLRPLAEETALCLVGCDAAGLEALLEKVHTSQTRPVCIELLNSAAARKINLPADSAWLVVVGFEENHAAVQWQVEKLQQELTPLKVEVRRADAAEGRSAPRLGNAVDVGCTPRFSGVPGRSSHLQGEPAAACCRWLRHQGRVAFGPDPHPGPGRQWHRLRPHRRRHRSGPRPDLDHRSPRGRNRRPG
jgi:glycolate oxidase FAD binding subunit